MPSPSDFAARGTVIETRDRSVVFQPHATTYRLHLLSEEPYAGPVDRPVSAHIRARARKIYTVPSGGNFIQPIFGQPRIIQGRVRFADERTLVLQAAALVVIDLPGADYAIDLTEGEIRLNHLVNVVALPGATFQLAENSAAKDNGGGH